MSGRLFDFTASAHAARQAIGWIRVDVWTECMWSDLPFSRLTDSQHMIGWHGARLLPLIYGLHTDATCISDLLNSQSFGDGFNVHANN